MRLALLAFLVTAPLAASELSDVMAGIELHYNRLATMQTDFEQTLSYGGRTRAAEHGRLLLLRPGKMRWDYAKPKGKLLIGDGDVIRMYNPYTEQVRTVRVLETADMRAPLSFLLGRLRLGRQFKNLRLEVLDSRPALVGDGRTGREAYTQVEFFYDSGYRLAEIRVLGRDDSVTRFSFANEILNETLDEELFVFVAPAGAEILPEFRLGDTQ